MSAKRNVNLAYIGGGLANTSAVYSLIQKFRQIQAEQISSGDRVSNFSGVTVHVFDRSLDKFGGGKAFDSSDPSFLYNNTFDDSVMNAAEHDLHRRFYNWLSENKDFWLGKIREVDSPALNEWLDKHEDEVTRDDYSQVYIPRFVFGMFLDTILDEVQTEGKKMGVDVKFISAEIVCNSKTTDANGKPKFRIGFGDAGPEEIILERPNSRNDGYRFRLCECETPELEYDILTFGLGFPPSLDFGEVAQSERYWDDHLDEKTPIGTKMKQIGDQVRQIYESFSKEEREAGKRVCIAAVGIGPSFMDFVHFCSDPKFSSMITIKGFSKNGKLPAAASRTYVNGEPYAPSFLTPNAEFDNADEISAAVKNEADLAKKNGYTDADVVQCLKDMMQVHPNRLLVNDYRGTRYIPDANGLTTTAPDSAVVGQKLLDEGVLQIVKSRVNPKNIEIKGNGSFEIAVNQGRESHNADLIIKFIGPGRLKSNPLANLAINSGLIDIDRDPTNGADVVCVSDCRETTTGVFVQGAMAFNAMVSGKMERHAGAGTCIAHAEAAAAELGPRVAGMIVKTRRGPSWPQRPGSSSISSLAQSERPQEPATNRVTSSRETPVNGRTITGLR